MKPVKRPLALAAAVLCVALAVVFVFGLGSGVVFAGVAALLGSAFWWVKQKQRAALCFVCAVVAALGVGLGAASQARADRVVQTYAGKTAAITAYVTESRDLSGTCLVTAQITQIDGKASDRFEISLFLDDEYMEIGDGFSATVVFGDRLNPYSKDAVSIQAKLEKLQNVSRGKYVFLVWAYRARAYLSHTVTGQLPGVTGEIAAAVITGDKTLVPTSLNIAFQRAGVSHILVVSGLHITLILGLLYGIFDRLRLHRFLSFGVLLGIIAACILFYGGTPSVLRACIMCLAVYSGRLLQRRADPPTSLGFAAIIILLINPRAIVDPSFLLSFGCCLALTSINPFVEHWIKNKWPGTGILHTVLRTVLCALALPITISVTTLPVLIMFGMPVSLVSPFANIAIVWATSFLLVAAFLMCVPFGLFTGFFGLIAGLCAKLTIVLSQFFASFAVASVGTSAPYLKVWLCFCGIVLAVCAVYKKYRVRPWFVGMCMALVLLIGMLSRLALIGNKPALTLYRDDVVIVQDGGRAILVVEDIDRAGVDYLLSYLRVRSIDRVLYVIITKDVGQTAELYLVEQLPDTPVFAAYHTVTAGIQSYPGARFEQPFGRYYIAVQADGGLEIKVGKSTLYIGAVDPDADYRSYDTVAARVRYDKYESYYLIAGLMYPADGNLVLYFGENGTVKPVVE